MWNRDGLRTGMRWMPAALLALCVSVGCQRPAVQDGAEFAPEQQMRGPTAFIQAQAAAGAAHDATVYPEHFNGEYLNSLGCAKLDLMVQGAVVGEPLVVYLNVPSDPSAYEHRAIAVANYLTEHGLASSRFRIEGGANPSATSPVASEMARMPKTESGGGNGATMGTDAAPDNGSGDQ